MIRTSRRLLSVALAAFALTACSQNEKNEVTAPNPLDLTVKGAISDDSNGGFNSDPVLQGEIANWFTKDPEQDGAEGMSVDRAYVELALKPGKKIVVAVIDSGVDISHPDLKNHIWVNKGEIPANQIDDDKNGYVDDVNGWNFIGGHDASGKNIDIDNENLEITREMHRLHLKQKAGDTLSAAEQAELATVEKEVADQRKPALDARDQYPKLDAKLQLLYAKLKSLSPAAYGDVTVKGLKELKPKHSVEASAIKQMLAIFKQINSGSVANMNARLQNANLIVDFYTNEDLSVRKDIVGDDPYNYADHHYGNNDVQGPSAKHGTHVAGIIAAERGNGIGMDGVSNEVQIMSVRTVPGGDERDKDVANAVRYAVDNGAQIINMSFGKNMSPGKTAVDEAFAYAEAHGVLLVHAAGNDSADNDTAANFPNKNLVDPASGQVIRQVSTWMEIGASSSKKGINLPAVFSNYGQTQVDIFAPGVRIYSTVPDNKYAVLSGTSMATPATVGAAALVLSQNPNLTAMQLKTAMLNSARRYDGLSVNLPTKTTNVQSVLFSQLSATGGIVDVLATLKSLSGAK